MNRELKFRAWHKEARLWVGEGYLLINNDGTAFWKEDGSKALEVVILQYTGLEDKNGKMIFEGDVVKYIDDEGDSATWNIKLQVVKFQEGSFIPVSERYSRYFEVIGNIYDNPELLNN